MLKFPKFLHFYLENIYNLKIRNNLVFLVFSNNNFLFLNLKTFNRSFVKKKHFSIINLLLFVVKLMTFNAILKLKLKIKNINCFLNMGIVWTKF